MPKNSLIGLLILTIVLLAGVVGWQQGQRDCEKQMGPLIETRFMPLKGCEIHIGDSWKTEADVKADVRQGVKEMQDGAKKALQGILGK